MGSERGRRRTGEVGDESRRRILDAAEELFAARGFERTSFIDISERSGISRGSIPWHFENKAGLLTAVVERVLDRALTREPYEMMPSLSEVFRNHAVWVRAGNSALLYMLMTEVMSSSGMVHDQYQQFLAQRREGLERWLRAHRPDGVDPEFASRQERAFAVVIQGAVWGIYLQALIDPVGVALEQALQLFAGGLDDNISRVWDTPPDLAVPTQLVRGDAAARNSPETT